MKGMKTYYGKIIFSNEEGTAVRWLCFTLEKTQRIMCFFHLHLKDWYINWRSANYCVSFMLKKKQKTQNNQQGHPCVNNK